MGDSGICNANETNARGQSAPERHRSLYTHINTTTYGYDQAQADHGTHCAQQHDRPPVEKIAHDEYQHCTDSGRRASQRAQSAPESRFRYFSDVRRRGTRAESRAESSQQTGRAQRNRTLRGVQQQRSRETGNVRQNHAPFFPVLVLQNARRETPDRVNDEHQTSYTTTIFIRTLSSNTGDLFTGPGREGIVVRPTPGRVRL